MKTLGGSSTSFDLDDRQFQAALVGYAAASGKDFADISNFKVQEASLWAAKKTKKASAASISILFKDQKLLWWIAHRIMKQSNAGGRYDNYAKALTRIRLRIKHISFMKAFFILMAKMITPYTGKTVNTRVGLIAGFFPWFKPATSNRQTAEAGITFTSRRWYAEDKQKVEKILKGAMRQGIIASIANMQKYIDRKTGATAKKYSAR